MRKDDYMETKQHATKKWKKKKKIYDEIKEEIKNTLRLMTMKI